MLCPCMYIWVMYQALYIISSNIYCGDHVMQYQHILWWPRDVVCGPIATVLLNSPQWQALVITVGGTAH